MLSVRNASEELLEVEVRSELEARERAVALHEFVRKHVPKADG